MKLSAVTLTLSLQVGAAFLQQQRAGSSDRLAVSGSMKRQSSHPLTRGYRVPSSFLRTNTFDHSIPTEDSTVESTTMMNRRKDSSSIKTAGLLFLAALVCSCCLPKVAFAASVAESGMMTYSSTATPVLLASPLNFAQQLQLSYRLLSATVLGILLGQARTTTTSKRPPAAGVRTMALVALGAAAFTVCSQYGFFGRGDPSRMASNVASGVGFVGAGVITTTSTGSRLASNKDKDKAPQQDTMVHGLATAAAIWLAAAVGVGCGAGLHVLSSSAAALTIVILKGERLLRHIKVKLRNRKGRRSPDAQRTAITLKNSAQKGAPRGASSLAKASQEQSKEFNDQFAFTTSSPSQLHDSLDDIARKQDIFADHLSLVGKQDWNDSSLQSLLDQQLNNYTATASSDEKNVISFVPKNTTAQETF